MGFKKTEKGNVIYEFDFTPTKLVPLAPKNANGYRHCYAVEGANGEWAPVFFELQGERHKNYALAFGFPADGGEMCVCSNICLVATLANMVESYEKSYDETREDYTTPDPSDTEKLASCGATFTIMTQEEAKTYYNQLAIPVTGYDVLRDRMS